MKHLAILVLILTSTTSLFSDPYFTEKKILSLSENWKEEVYFLAEYSSLKTLCVDQEQRVSIYSLLETIHEYHDELYTDLQTTKYNHSKRTIKRILREIDRLEEKYNPEKFSDFFQEQCSLQYKIEKGSDHYKAGFGVHSYDGKVYAQETEIYRYLKRLTKRIDRIKKHVAHFYMRRTVWES